LADLVFMDLIIYAEYTVPIFGHTELRPSFIRICSSSGARCAHQIVYVTGAQQFSVTCHLRSVVLPHTRSVILGQ